ncbi:MAG: hypothetical protein RIR73_904 [Chloroflexota bacterium]
MKRHYLIVIAIFVLISGCTIDLQSPTAPAFVEELSSTLTQSSFETETSAMFTPTPTVAVATPEIFPATDRVVIFRDEFADRLENGWEWVNEDPSTWSLSAMRGSLQIQSEFGYVQFGSAKNVLLRDAPEGNFIVETSINFLARDADQFAGIVLLESENDFIQSGLGYCAEASGCIQDAFYIDTFENGSLMLPREFFSFEDTTLSVRILFQDGNLQIFTSPNGLVWYRTSFERPLSFKPLKVGLFAGQNTDPALIPASFAYFEISIPK